MVKPRRGNAPIFWFSSKPSKRKPRLSIQAWTKRAMQSSELLRSDVVSSFSWVGRAFAAAASTAAGPSGSDDIVW
jgi:hypothetical protein